MPRQIHPTLSRNSVKCSGCGHTFQVFTTMRDEAFDIEVCNQCHSAYTGKRRASTKGRAEAFNTKYAGFSSFTTNAAQEDNSEKGN